MDAQSCWRVSEFAELLSVSASTLKRWDKAGTLVPGRYPSGVKYYTVDHIERALGLSGEERSVPHRTFLSMEIKRLLGAGVPLQDALRLARAAWSDRASLSENAV